MVWRDMASSVWGNFTGLSKQCLTRKQSPGQLLWLIADESKTNRQKEVMNLSSGPDLLQLPVVVSKPFNSRSREFLCHRFFQTEQQNPESGTMAVIKGPESPLFPPHHLLFTVQKTCVQCLQVKLFPYNTIKDHLIWFSLKSLSNPILKINL